MWIVVVVRGREGRYIMGRLLAFSYDTGARKRNKRRYMKQGNVRKLAVVNPSADANPSARYKPGGAQRRIGSIAAPLSVDVGCPIQVESSPAQSEQVRRPDQR